MRETSTSKHDASCDRKMGWTQVWVGDMSWTDPEVKWKDRHKTTGVGRSFWP